MSDEELTMHLEADGADDPVVQTTRQYATGLELLRAQLQKRIETYASWMDDETGMDSYTIRHQEAYEIFQLVEALIKIEHEPA